VLGRAIVAKAQRSDTATSFPACSSSFSLAADQGDQKEDDEYQKQDLGDASGSSHDASEAQEACH
jgi:hypothetical protein